MPKGAWTRYSEIEGLGECLKKFQQIENAFGGRSERLLGVLLRNAQLIRDTAKSLAPSGPTGNLKRGQVAKTYMYQIPDSPAAFAAIDYRIAPHAHLLEFGHLARDGGHVPAVPFFRPAVDAVRNTIFMNMKREMQTMIMQAAKK